jgi:predicted site-specific integrase-resolvase
MSDCVKPDDHSQTKNHENGASEAGRALVAGILGGLASAAGYVVYSRLSDEQKDRLHQQVRTVVESRVNEIRSSLNL